MDPQQELYTAILVALREKYGDMVFDGALPPAKTPYPFIYLADTEQYDEVNKSAIFGDVTITIHVYHNQVTKRGTLSEIIGGIKEVVRGIDHTPNFAWFMRRGGVRQQIIPDYTTDKPLMHGILTLTISFS